MNGMRKPVEQTLYFQDDITQCRNHDFTPQISGWKIFQNLFSEPKEIWLLGSLVGRSCFFLRSPKGSEGQNQYKKNVVSNTVLFFPPAESSQLPLMRFGLLPIMGVPALKPSFGGGGGGEECSFFPCWGKWNPALHLLHGRSKIMYHLVLSNELRGEASYLGGLWEREGRQEKTKI